jgi:hypothetical protein
VEEKRSKRGTQMGRALSTEWSTRVSITFATSLPSTPASGAPDDLWAPTPLRMRRPARQAPPGIPSRAGLLPAAPVALIIFPPSLCLCLSG